jgi:hypothetical protein
MLTFGRFGDVQEALVELLEPRVPQAVQVAAVRALSTFARPEVSTLLLNRYSSSTPSVRGEMIEALLARLERIAPLLDLVEAGTIPAAHIPISRRALLIKHTDPSVRHRADRLFGSRITA